MRVRTTSIRGAMLGQSESKGLKKGANFPVPIRTLSWKGYTRDSGKGR